MKNYALLLLVGCFALFWSACQQNTIFSEEKNIANGTWTYLDSLNFRFNVSDTAARYNIYLDFDHASNYSAQNVYLKLYTLFPDGKRLEKVLPIDFFDTQGNSYGKCSNGDCSLRAVLQENARFKNTGDYAITLAQYTRQDSLHGIAQIGLVIEKNK